jgi:uncharacterized protein
VTRYLLDVNVLVALIDQKHDHFSRAQRWFAADPDIEWMLCPLVQLGVIRIASNPRFGSTSSPRVAAESLQSVVARGNCTFVPDDLDMLDDMVFSHEAIRTHGQVTDIYLVALAARHGAALATFDQKIATEAVRSPDAEIFLIP